MWQFFNVRVSDICVRSCVCICVRSNWVIHLHVTVCQSGSGQVICVSVSGHVCIHRRKLLLGSNTLRLACFWAPTLRKCLHVLHTSVCSQYLYRGPQQVSVRLTKASVVWHYTGSPTSKCPRIHSLSLFSGHKIVTRGLLKSRKCLAAGLCPDPLGSLSGPPDHLAYF